MLPNSSGWHNKANAKKTSLLVYKAQWKGLMLRNSLLTAVKTTPQKWLKHYDCSWGLQPPSPIPVTNIPGYTVRPNSWGALLKRAGASLLAGYRCCKVRFLLHQNVTENRVSRDWNERVCLTNTGWVSSEINLIVNLKLISLVNNFNTCDCSQLEEKNREADWSCFTHSWRDQDFYADRNKRFVRKRLFHALTSFFQQRTSSTRNILPLLNERLAYRRKYGSAMFMLWHQLQNFLKCMQSSWSQCIAVVCSEVQPEWDH